MPRRKSAQKPRNSRRKRPPRRENFIKFLGVAVAIIVFCYAMVLRFTTPPMGGGDADEQRTEPEPPAIVVDAGHGGVDGGTVGNGMVEKKFALEIAERLTGLLREKGYRVVMTRDGDEFLSLEERVALSNSERRLAFISVHLNAGPPSVAGIETFYSEPKALDAARRIQREFADTSGQRVVDERARILGEAVQEAVCRRSGAIDRGVKNRADLAVTRRTYCPAVLVECGFLTHTKEAARVRTSAYRQALAEGIAEGVDTYLQAASGDPYYGIKTDGSPVADGR